MWLRIEILHSSDSSLFLTWFFVAFVVLFGVQRLIQFLTLAKEERWKNYELSHITKKEILSGKQFSYNVKFAPNVHGGCNISLCSQQVLEESLFAVCCSTQKQLGSQTRDSSQAMSLLDEITETREPKRVRHKRDEPMWNWHQNIHQQTLF